MMNDRRRHGIAVAAAVAVAFVLGCSPALATEEAAQPTVQAEDAVTPVAASDPNISFGRCHFQKTPPYEPRVRLECDAGEVVVAVFEDGIRCCELKLR